MRTSAASIKSRGSGSPLRTEPREGTKLRHWYDIAMKGHWFSIQSLKDGERKGIRDQLRDRYELELIRKPDPADTRGSSNTHQLYKCIGVWDGDHLRSLEDVEVAIEHTQKG